MQLLSSWGGLGLQARLPSWGDQALLMAGQDPPPGWELQSLLLVGPPGSPDRRPSWDVLPALEDLAPPPQQPPAIPSHNHSSTAGQVPSSNHGSLHDCLTCPPFADGVPGVLHALPSSCSCGCIIRLPAAACGCV